MIKVILLLSLGACYLAAFRGGRNASAIAMRRLGMIAGLGLGAVAIAFPNMVTSAAQFVGVGRGADLLLYCLCMAFLITSIALYRRLHDLEDRYVAIVQGLAIDTGTDLDAAQVATEGTPNEQGQ